MFADPAAHVGIDADGVVTEWDEGAGVLFGHTPEQALGRPVAELIVPPALRPAHTRGLRRVATGGASVLVGRTVEVPALDVVGRPLRVALSIVEADAPPTHFRAILVAVDAHSDPARPDSADP